MSNTDFIIQSIAFLVMGLGFLWDLVTFYWKKGEHYRDLKSTIVTVGVLGTFAGIYIGLNGFDTGNVRDSLPPLLEGLKTAFRTSIGGMSLAMLLTVIQKISPSSHSEEGLVNNYIRSIDQNLSALTLSSHYFQDLDSAAKKTLEWHAVYIGSLNQIKDQQEAAKNSLEVASSVLSDLAQTQQVLTNSIQQLDALLPKMKDHTDALSESLALYQDNRVHLKEYNDQLEKALGEIKRIPSTVSESVETATTTGAREISKLVGNATKESMAAVGDAAKEANRLSARAVVEAMDEVERMPRRMQRSIEQSVDVARRDLNNLTSTLTAWEAAHLESWKTQVGTAMDGVGQSLTQSARQAEQQHSSALSQISSAIDSHGHNIQQLLIKTESYINSISERFHHLSKMEAQK